MSILFNHTEPVEYNGTTILVHWTRHQLKKKTGIRLSDDDNGYISYEKDYISFTYKGKSIEDNYEADEYDLTNRVFKLCYNIDSESDE